MNGNDLKTKASTTDVTATEPIIWNLIDWDKVSAHVNGLQSRIAKAASEGKKEKVRKLQRQLTHSMDAKLLAVHKVTSNKGKNTPGVDGVLWKTPAQKARAATQLTSKGYKAKPLRRIYIEKKGKKGKMRPLGIPTMHDRAMQALYALALDPVAEVTADRHSFGFRKGRCAQDAGEQLFTVLAQKTCASWVLEGDIKGCFDHISHEWLLENIPMDKQVLHQFLKAGYMEQSRWYDTVEGTPQGGIISPILANMALDGIDKLLDDKYHCNRVGNLDQNISRKYKVNFVRYADDFVVTANTKETAEEVKALIAEHLNKRGLELSEEKTLITHIDDGFDFLGWNLRKFSGKLIIQPSKQSVQRFVDSLHETILIKGKTLPQDELIRILNPKIRGFTNYHRHICATAAFSKVEYHVYTLLRRWAKRRHPNKGKRWRYKKYWVTLGKDRYIFGTSDSYLAKPTWQHIIRRTALKTEMNPYLNPDYFARRKEKLAERYAHSFRRPAAE